MLFHSMRHYWRQVPAITNQPGKSRLILGIDPINPSWSASLATIDIVRSTVGQVLQLGARQDSLNPESTLLGSIPELDSMAVVSLISALEDQFGIMIDDDEIDASTFATLGSLTEFCELKQRS